MDKSFAIPGSILLGSCVIGAGLYFGLQSRAAPPAPVLRNDGMEERATRMAPLPPPAPSRELVQPPSPAGMPGLAMPGVPADVQQSATRAARDALEATRPELLKTCWAPAFAKSPTPALAKYVYRMTFDSQGKEIARGISETREAARSDVAACLRQLPMGLSVPSPGVNVAVEIPFVLP